MLEVAPKDINSARAASRLVVIEPTRGLSWFGIFELWEYRELLYFMVWRDLKVRYKQTILGALWAVLQPLCAMIIFTVFFGRMAGVPSDGIPYPLFSYTGVIIWTFFSQAVNQSSTSLVNSPHLITKVYFPRLIRPLASIVAAVVDLAIAGVLLVGLLVIYGVRPHSNAWLALPMVALAFVAATGVGTWFCALDVRYRDVRYVVPFLLQMWLFLSPVIYPASFVGPRLEALGLPEWILGLNPMAGAVEGFRWAILGIDHSPLGTVLLSWAVALVLLFSGVLFFRWQERMFADIV